MIKKSFSRPVADRETWRWFDVRQRTARACLFLLVLFMIHTAHTGLSSEHEFRSATPGYEYRFPYDHGSHDTFRTEWWYYTGHLTATNGHRVGFQLTFFRRAIPQDQIKTHASRWTISHLYLAHFALSDVDNRKFYVAEKLSRAGLGKAGADAGHLHVWIDRWRIDAPPGNQSSHRLQASGQDFSIDLVATPGKPPVVHGADGISRKGIDSGQASHYYSLTRLETEGTVSIGQVRLPVRGTSWMDHEFGSADLGGDLVGWDWFSLQLTNRTELMLYQLRRADGTSDPASSGTLILDDGRTKTLTVSDMRIEPLGYWTSPASGARYPSRWKITVPSLDCSFEVSPLLADQELVTRRSTQVTYWEGAVQVSGIVNGTAVSGQGYVELTGYAERLH
ncbi:MAG: lipocalin-like domain-containing protein [Nitrospiraceae bacterium]